MTQNTAWTSGELLAEAEGSLGSYMRSAVTDYYRGRDLDTAQAIRRAPNDTEAAELITAMRRGRWQDLLLIAGMAAAGVGMGAALQRLLGDPRLAGVSPVAVTLRSTASTSLRQRCMRSRCRTISSAISRENDCTLRRLSHSAWRTFSKTTCIVSK